MAYDLPIINIDMAMDFASWPAPGAPMADPISRPPSAREQYLCGIGAGTDHHLDMLHNHSSFPEALDFGARRLSGTLYYPELKDLTFAPFDMSFSQQGYQHDSPRSDDSSQSGDTFSASCYTDDLNTQIPNPRCSISSPSMMQEPYFSQRYPIAAQSPQLPPALGGGISLGEVQNFQDQMPDFQDSAYSEPDAEGESDHEYPTPATLEDPPKRSPRKERVYRSTVAESIQDSMSEDFEPEEEEEDGDYNPRRSTTKRSRRVMAHRRASHGRRTSSATNGGRVSKSKTRRPSSTGQVRPFPCPLALYGCGATFTSKNEWKRHVSTQHIKLGFWRCDMCGYGDPANPTHNDFNRKDLFTQHLRRMHRNDPLTKSTYINDAGEEELTDSALLAHQERCYLVLRANPEHSTCLFTSCDQTFHGEGSWEERMEHVGSHMEKDRKANKSVVPCGEWHEDMELRDYLEHEGLIEYDNGNWSIGSGYPRRDLGF